MEFAFTEEQDQFRDIVARFCRDKAPTSQIRKLIETDQGYDPNVWRQLCQDIGATGIHIAEDKGGVGFGAVELGIVMEEFGRSLIPLPYFACAVLACTAAAEIEDAGTREKLLSQMMSGEKIGTLALDSRHGDPVSPYIAEKDSLSGTCDLVVNGDSADLIFAIVTEAQGNALFVVEGNAASVTITPRRAMDGTRKLAQVTLDNTPAERLGSLDAAQVKRIYDTAVVALANEMVGGAQALLDAAVEYTKLRFQFGRAIGSFQAIKHRLADLLVDVELARAGAYQAAQALVAGEEVSSNASLAKFVANETYLHTALETIQFHGGIGFTWENDTHLWFRRAKSSEVFMGSTSFHRERMLREMQV